MEKFKRIVILLLITSMLFVSCATSGTVSKAQLAKTQERMLWKISGTDKNGNLSTVYLQGTIHVGDERLVVSKEVEKLFLSADRRVGEIASDDYAVIIQKVSEMMIESAKVAANRDFRNDLSKEENDFLAGSINAEMLENFAKFEPWVINSVLSTSTLTGLNLDANKALDTYFVNLAAANGYKTAGLDELKTQLDLVRFGDWNDQLEALSGTIQIFLDPEKKAEALIEITDLYNAYINNDYEKIDQLIDDSKNSAETDYEKRYNRFLWQARNEAWAKKIAQYIKDGGTTFVFVGCGHLAGSENVFTAMQKNGQLKLAAETEIE